MKSQILSQADKYILSLLNCNFVDFKGLEYFDDRMILLPLIVSDIPRMSEPLDDERDTAINNAISDGDIFLAYDPINHVTEALVTEHGAVRRNYDILPILFFMEENKHPNLKKYRLAYCVLNAFIKDRFKSKILELMTETKGDFVKDNFINDTYFQLRCCNGENVYYIIYRWWDKLINKAVKFTDIDNGKGAVFVALND